MTSPASTSRSASGTDKGHREDLLTLDAEQVTAGGEDAQPRGRGKQLAGEHRAGVGEVLTVVEHHEEALRLEVGSEIGGRIGPLLGQRGAAACMPFATRHGRAAELSAVRYLVPLRAT